MDLKRKKSKKSLNFNFRASNKIMIILILKNIRFFYFFLEEEKKNNLTNFIFDFYY